MSAVRLDAADADAFDEFLVAVRRVELHEPHAIRAVVRQQPREAAGDVRLARARHALQDELLLQPQQSEYAVEPTSERIRLAVERGRVVGRRVRRGAGPAGEQRARVGLGGAREQRTAGGRR